MLSLDLFDYHLPPELIAHTPLPKRDESRLIVVERETGKLTHRHFYDLPELLTAIDVLIRNNTKVLPVRLFGKKSTGGVIELLLIKRVGIQAEKEIWEVLSKPGIKLGQRVTFPGSALLAECIGGEGYTRQVQFNQGGQQLFESLYQIGNTPIPHYIHWDETDEQTIRERYQTIYAKLEGSAAAPTAGLHFTQEVEARLHVKGIETLEVTLHVGLGTFLPVKTDDITQHHIHSEAYEITESVAARFNALKKQGKRMIAVGTTTARTLESNVNEQGELQAGRGETQIFIYPPYQFRAIDGLITNYHLPKSTLLMMISALVSAPNTTQEFTSFEHSLIGKAYAQAIEQNHRFYSFGDAMLIR